MFMLRQTNAGLGGLYSTLSMAGSQSNIYVLKQSPGYFALLRCFNPRVLSRSLTSASFIQASDLA